jgi:hypothetical protein
MTFEQMQQARAEFIDKAIATLERTVMGDYKARREEVLAIVRNYYDRYLDNVDKADYYKTLSLYNRLQEMEKDIKAVYIKLARESKQQVINGQYQLFDEAYLRDRYTTAFFSDSIGKQIKYQPPNPLVRDVAVTGDATRLKEIANKKLRDIAAGMMPPSGQTLTEMLLANNTVGLNRVLKTVKSGLINGESYSRQVNRVKDVFDGNVSNTARIIRTEGNRNMNAGSYLNTEDLKSEGVKVRRMWVATLDSRTRDSHQALDGVYEDANGLWHIGGDSARYPNDFSDPAESINCRCTTIDVIENAPPTLRRGKDPVTGKSEIASYSTYNEWKK